jgi:uncharacterized protein (DUF302 family)
MTQEVPMEPSPQSAPGIASDTRRELDAPFDEVVERLPAALAQEGFGVLTRIDMRETLAKKLGVDFRRYIILGACNPPLAYEALQAELEVGLMLPCNIIVYETDGGATMVVAIDPSATIAAGHPGLSAVAQTVRAKLARVLTLLG